MAVAALLRREHVRSALHPCVNLFPNKDRLNKSTGGMPGGDFHLLNLSMEYGAGATQHFEHIAALELDFWDTSPRASIQTVSEQQLHPMGLPSYVPANHLVSFHRNVSNT